MGVGLDTESDDIVAIYEPIYELEKDLIARGVQMFVRTLSEFMEEIEINGEKRARFIRLA